MPESDPQTRFSGGRRYAESGVTIVGKSVGSREVVVLQDDGSSRGQKVTFLNVA